MNHKGNIVIVNEDLNHMWRENQLNDIADMWNMGIPAEMIAQNFACDPDEIVLAAASKPI